MYNKSTNTYCSSNCCTGNELKKESWVTGYKDTQAGKIPIVSTKLNFKDILGNWKVRWAIGRDRYTVDPGIYGVGNPSEESPVLVTANYKLTFDKLRKELSDVDAWILVLDTKGINVWCAAGKGTFGTDELINRIKVTNLDKLVNHRKIIMPQLGAPGVSAHIVKQETGFRPVYGPVYAKDIPEYLASNLKKTKEMAEVRFKLPGRLAVIPVELVQSLKYILITFFVVAVVTVIWDKSLSLNILMNFIPYLGAFITGLVLTPVLLPFIPIRSFSLKGFFLGIIWAAIVTVVFKLSVFTAVSHFLILPAVSAFLAMNYTGASTFTSPTGARLEVKYTFIPSIVALVSGIIVMGVNIFI